MPKDTESQILDAAKKIFVQKGFAGARMQEIADEANINKAMLHYYFRNKESLFERILENAIDAVFPKLVESLMTEGMVIQKLERLVNSYIDVILENSYLPMFLLHEISQNRMGMIDKMKSKMEQHHVLAQFSKQVLEEQARGILKPIMPQHILLTVMSLIIFPFMAKPVFLKMLDIPKPLFNQMMEERKEVVINFLKAGLLV
jgi:AcrR family transcriptional regulator